MAIPASVSGVLDSKSDRILRLRRKNAAGRDGLRAEIVLRAAAGQPNLCISQDLGVSRNTVKLWRRRFAEEGLKGLESRPIPGRPKKTTTPKHPSADSAEPSSFPPRLSIERL